MARKKRELRDLITRLYPIVWPAMREEYVPDCCIAAASVLRRVFQLYGYPSEPIPVKVLIHNAAMLKLYSNPSYKDPEDRRERSRIWSLTGAWGVGIMPESAIISAAKGRAAFGGHVLLRVGNYVLDASLKQADRPQYKIELPPLIWTYAYPKFLDGERMPLMVGECRVEYTRIDDYSFKTAPDWMRRTMPFPETVSKIVQRVEAEAIVERIEAREYEADTQESA